ncbi:hypothetical protein Q7A53_02015 [Halobacillus rhizosphaerae]|uniref:hypothetical protein n=1 Tax=Halobacillus rhizosphaerae TaxID=3064889 RepID=UPI00398B6332
MIKRYPKKSSIRRVIKEHLTAKDSKDFLKERGILVHCVKKSDLSKIGGDFYFNKSDFIDLKKRMDVDHNFKKSGRITLPKSQREEFQDSLISLNNKVINEADNTKISVSRDTQGNTNILLTYDEYKPSLIDLLDRTTRQVEINLNTIDEQDKFGIDFNMQSSNDYKKVKELVKYMSSTDEEVQFEFEEISLSKLTKTGRIKLFEDFFKKDNSPWELIEIRKLKVKRDKKEANIEGNQLQGINSAILDGDNLSENEFVKSTIDKGFYFSMASMRLDHMSQPTFIDLVIDFKSRPEMCEVKIANSGSYEEDEETSEMKEVKSVLDSIEQDNLLVEFKNTLYEVFIELTDEDITPVEMIPNNN